MRFSVAALALARQATMILAFAMVVAAGIVVSVGAWILLWRDRRARRD